jgi:hypothetical protein
MMRRVAVGLLAVALAVAGLAVAQEPGDEPPLRLKKKDRPAAADKAKEEVPKGDPARPPEPPEKKPDAPKEQPKDGADEPPDAGAPPEMDEQEVLGRVNKNMRAAEDRLANRELNDGTRQLQDDILKDLDALINQVQNGGQGQDQNDQQAQQNDNQQGGKQQARRNRSQGQGQPRPGIGGRRGNRRQAARRPGGQKQGSGGQAQSNQKAQNGNSLQGGGGGQSGGAPNKLAEIYKDRWGELPETMREAMNAYQKEHFMLRYDDLIKQYYTTVAEKNRRKE